MMNQIKLARLAVSIQRKVLSLAALSVVFTNEGHNAVKFFETALYKYVELKIRLHYLLNPLPQGAQVVCK